MLCDDTDSNGAADRRQNAGNAERTPLSNECTGTVHGAIKVRAHPGPFRGDNVRFGGRGLVHSLCTDPLSLSAHLFAVLISQEIEIVYEEPSDEVVATDSDGEADTEMPTVRNLHFSVASNSTADAME